MSTNRQPDSKPTVRENGIFRGALQSKRVNATFRKRIWVLALPPELTTGEASSSI